MATFTPSYIDNYNQQQDKAELSKNIHIRLTILSVEDTSPETNKAKVTWKVTIEGRPWTQLSAYKVVLGGKTISERYTAVTNWSTGQQLDTGTTEFDRNTDGTLTLSATLRQLFYYGYSASRWADDSKCEQITSSIQLSQLYRKSIISFNKTSCETNAVVRINTNAYSSGFTHKMYYSIGSINREEIGTGITEYKDWAIPTKVNNQITTSTKGIATIYCQTYNGTELIGEDSKTIEVIVPTSIVPTLNTLSVSEGNSVVSGKGWSLGTQKYIEGLSKLNVSITDTPNSGASITNYSTTINNGTPNPDKTFTSNPLNFSGSANVVATITDSRGRTASKTQAINVIPYSNPTITSASAKRCNADGTDNDNGTSLKYTFKGSISPINNGSTNFNSKTYKISTREVGTSTWTDNTISESSYTLNKDGVVLSGKTFSADKQYEVKFTIQDSFNTTEITNLLETGFDLLNFKSDGKGMAIGKVASKTDTLEIALETEFNKNITIPTNYGYKSNGTTILRNNGTATVLSSKNDTLYLRAVGNDSNTNQATLGTDGKFIAPKLSGLLDCTQGEHKLSNGTYTDPLSGITCGLKVSGNLAGGVVYSNGVRCYGVKSLYDNSNGSNGTITLNESVANFTYIEIFARSNDNVYSSQKYFSPNGKTVQMMSAYVSTNMWIKATKWSINGTTIKPEAGGEGRLDTSFGSGYNHYITKVIGYK